MTRILVFVTKCDKMRYYGFLRAICSIALRSGYTADSIDFSNGPKKKSVSSKLLNAEEVFDIFQRQYRRLLNYWLLFFYTTRTVAILLGVFFGLDMAYDTYRKHGFGIVKLIIIQIVDPQMNNIYSPHIKNFTYLYD